VALVAATFLCALVAGFLFAFAAVVMPGIHALDDREYLRAFQVIDGVIQKGQPLFMVVGLGSAVALLAADVLCGLYLGGVVRFVKVPSASMTAFHRVSLASIHGNVAESESWDLNHIVEGHRL